MIGTAAPSPAYADFLARKMRREPDPGIRIAPTELHPFLHAWQAEIVAWALNTARAAIWADTGLGKTVMQIEWARVVAQRTSTPVLIVAPLAVAHQTAREGDKVGVPIEYVRHHDDITGPGVWITNYEMAQHFDAARLGGIVLDEASILKNETGATRNALIAQFGALPFRLSCTATPAPNDPEELTSQAEFLGHMTRSNMLAAYFVHDSDAGWRLKGHAARPMFAWMASWAVAIRRPSDMGHPDDGYLLPGIDIVPEIVAYDHVPEGQLFATDLGGVGGRAAVRRETIADRVARAVELVHAEPGEPWILWCGMNAEADALAAAIPGAVNVHGSMTPEEKAKHLLGFADGTIRVLITKPKIASFGMNWQHCARMAFVGLSDSYEAYYQAIRRCHRYGQTRVVRAHIITSDLEQQIAYNVARKEATASEWTAQLVDAMNTHRKENAA